MHPSMGLSMPDSPSFLSAVYRCTDDLRLFFRLLIFLFPILFSLKEEEFICASVHPASLGGLSGLSIAITG
jgi:hypothetical protein